MIPLSAIFPPASRMTRKVSPSSCKMIGTMPKRMPCTESHRMQAPIRLVPRRAKQVSRPSACTVSRRAGMVDLGEDNDERQGRERGGADDERRQVYQPIAGHRRLDYADRDAQYAHAEEKHDAVDP